MRAWMIRNLKSFLAGLASTQDGRELIAEAMHSGSCVFCGADVEEQGACAAALLDVEDELRCAAEYLASARLDNGLTAGHSDMLTRAVGALVSARSSLFVAMRPDADAADVHEALFRRGDA